MVACAMLAAFFMLRADLTRRGLTASSDKLPRKPPAKVHTKNTAKDSRDTSIPLTKKNASEGQSQPSQHSANAEAEMLIAIPCLAGIVGAKLYHVLETPATFFAHPLQELLSQYGFAWFGGLLAGFAAFVWVGRHQQIPLLTLLDAGSPPPALGYGIGRIGCFLSGDGDYGIPTALPWGMSFPNGLVPTTARVHPTPIYELLVACAIAWFLWRMGAHDPTTQAGARQAAQKPQKKSAAVYAADMASASAAGIAPGKVFAMYLILTGVARFLVEFIRINPRSFFGLSNAQAAGALSALLGIALYAKLRH